MVESNEIVENSALLCETSVHYWQNELTGASATLDMFCDGRRPTIGHSIEVNSVSFEIPGEMARSLMDLCIAEEVTPSTVLLSALGVVLNRYTMQEDILVAYPIQSKEDTDSRLVKVLPIRMIIKSDETFFSLLNSTQTKLDKALEYRHISHAELSRIAQHLKAHSSHCARALFNLNNVDEDHKEITDNIIEGVFDTCRYQDIDIALNVRMSGAKLHCELYYADKLFDRGIAEGLATSFIAALRDSLENPRKLVRTLRLLGIEQKEVILGQWARGLQRQNIASAHPGDALCIHELFELHAIQRPDALALDYVGLQLTYSQLNRIANRLAHYLRSLDIGVEAPVVLCLGNTAHFVIAALACAKAGGFYIPIDPLFPSERQAYIVQNSKPKVIISTRSQAGNLPWSTIPVVLLENELDLFPTFPESNPSQVAHRRNLINAIYTSGSTGQPKGVMIEHIGLTRLVLNPGYIDISPNDRISQSANTTFDASTLEIWGALANGATLVQITGDELLGNLKKTLISRRISILFMSVALLNQIVSEEPDTFDSVDQLLIGGDKLGPAFIYKLLNHGGGRPKSVKNGYGPTEGSTCAACEEIAAVHEDSSSIPIGYPIRETALYVLDEEMQPVAVGVPGELYIGGHAVARGYLNREELTRERFLKDPFSTEADARLYKTGDLVRWLSDGRLDFIGRTDFQVKVRGYRVELGEIEAAFLRHTEIRNCCVIANRSSENEIHLVAYISTIPQHLRATLYQAVSSQLPTYMLPRHLVELEPFPLTTSGKIDRKALPEPRDRDLFCQFTEVDPTLAHNVIESHNIAPDQEQSPTRILTDIWMKLLARKDIGPDQDFFDLGGDSISMLRLIAEAKKQGIVLSPNACLRHRTIRSLAANLDCNMSCQAIVSEEPKGEVPLLASQLRFLEENAISLVKLLNIELVLEIDASFTVDQVNCCIKELLSHHQALSYRIKHTESGWSQQPSIIDETRIARGVHFSDEDALRNYLNDEVERIRNTMQPINGPLTYFTLVEQATTDSHVLLIVMNHLISDHYSCLILVDDLETLLEQSRESKRLHLANESISYSAWAKTSQDLALSQELKSEIPYWRTLAQRGLKRIPYDFSGGPGFVDTLECNLDPLATSRLREEVAASARVGVSEVILSALAEAHAAIVGEDALLVRMVGSGRDSRDEIDLTRTFAWIAYHYPVLIDLSGTKTHGELFTRTKQALQSAPARGLGYGLLRFSDGRPDTKTSLAPLPELWNLPIYFNYLGTFMSDMSAGQLVRWSKIQLASAPDYVDDCHQLSFIASIMGGCLNIKLVYGVNYHRKETVQRLLDSTIIRLNQYLNHNRS